MRDWLSSEIVVELWETRPAIKEKKNEDESISKEVVLREDGRPKIEERQRGVSLLNK